MATALQKQLAVIAANSTHQLDLKAQKAAHGKSLLFDPKVAASQDFNTIYRICIEGFQELCSLDGRFDRYADTIFSEQSKSEERGLMTKAQNDELDAVVEGFLGLVSGRLLLKPAQKAVEWLIRRFRIHEFNTQMLILAFLPYHATPLFLSLLDILPKQIPHTFRFLYPSISTMQNPPFHTLLHTATNNAAFFTAYNTFVLSSCRARHHAPAVLSFWASLTSQAVHAQVLAATSSGRKAVRKEKMEDLLLRVLPVLNEALWPQLAEVTDLVLGALMVVMVLAHGGGLEDEVLDGLMAAVVQMTTPQTVEERISALAACAMHRSALETSKVVTKKLLKNEALLDQLIQAQQKVSTGRLVLGLILRDLKAKSKNDGYLSLALITKLLQADALSEEHEKAFCERLVEIMSKDVTEAQRQALGVIVEFLQESSSSQTRLQDAITKSKVSQETVEDALQTTLLLTNGSAEMETNGDVEMVDVHAANDAFSDIFEKLSDKVLLNSSFLSLEAAEDYAVLKAAYLESLSSETKLAQLLKISAIHSTAEPITVACTTLLLRLSHDPSLTLKARSTALRCLSKLAKEESVSHAAIQFIVPYLLSALTSNAGSIRQIAAELLAVIVKSYKASESSKHRSGVEFHRDTYPWEVLSTDNAQHVLEHVIMPTIEEAVLDANSIVRAVASKLSSPVSEDKKSKKAQMTMNAEICTYFAEHAEGTTIPSVKLALLQMVNGSGLVANHAQSKLQTALNDAIVFGLKLVDAERLDLNVRSELDAELWRCITPSSVSGLEFLAAVLAGESSGTEPSPLRAAYTRTAEIWTKMPVDMQQRVVFILVNASLRDLSMPALDADVCQTLGQETIRSLSLPTEVLLGLLNSLPNALNMPNADGPPSAKRRRTSRSEQARLSAVGPADLSKALSKYTLILELVEANKPGEKPELLQPLFRVLEELQDFRRQTSSGLAYLQISALGSLLAIVDRLKSQKDQNTKAKADLSIIRTDLIVDVIRHSTSAQVQSTALLLISSLASWQPESVVNSIMPIFTFMGTTILRQGDEYSAHVTERTISKVIPPLVESFRKKNKDVVVGASSLLLSFSAAFEHIPQQRRLALFEHLARTVGAEECLYALIAMLVDAYPTDARVRRFSAELLTQFEPSISLKTVKRCIDLVWDVFRSRRTISNSVLGMNEKPKETHDNVAANLLTALSELLHDRHLKSAMSKSFQSEDIDVANAQRLACVELIQEAIRLNGFMKTKADLTQPAANLLSAIVGLLPTVELVQCAETLLAQKDDEVRLVAIGSVLSRASEVRQPSSEDVASLLGFLARLTELLSNTDSVAIASQAITCAVTIIKSFGRKDREVAMKAAQVIAGQHALGDADARVQLASVVCLTTVVRVLKDEFIPLVPAVLPTVLSYLQQALRGEEQGKSLTLAIGCFAFVHALVEHLPFLLTGESLDKVIVLLAQAADGASKLKEPRMGLWRLLAKNTDADEMSSAFERNFGGVAGLGSLQAIVEMFSSLRLAITSHTKSAVIRNASTLFSLFLQAFDQPRNVQSSNNDEADLSNDELERLQSIYHEVALAMVMKLNDATFRPFIMRLSEWAVQLPKKDVAGRASRATALFNFLASLFAKLKGLVTSYATYVLDLAVDVLTNTEPTRNDQADLLAATLSALSESFEHDDEQFWQAPHHFTPVSTPLLALIPKVALSPHLELLSKLHNTLLALASSTSSPDHHKALNQALLKLLRHEDGKVRLAAVRLERELCEKMGDEWLGMLPEMLPFVAEVLEDDVKEVERAGREWVRWLEGVLGEGLELG